jgi:hypothetical protein
MNGMMAATFTTIGAERARELLANNNANRPLRKSVIRAYAAEMIAGRWKDSPQPVIVDTNGNLIDGQHRMTAVVEAAKKNPGVTIRCVLIGGVSGDLFDVLDQGVTRTPRDLLCRNGTHRVVPSILRAMVAYDRPMTDYKRGRMLNSRMNILFERFGDAAQWVATFSPQGRAPLSASVMAVVARALVVGRPKEPLAAFCETIKSNQPSGIDANADATALSLARYLTSVSLNGGGSGAEVTARTERALAAALSGERLANIKPAAANPFPIGQLGLF